MLCTYTGSDKPTLESLNNHVRDEIAPQWYDFGKQLLEDEYVDKLDDIEKNHPGDKERCCTEMFRYWLEVDSEANWNNMTDALKQTGQRSVAKKVKDVLQGIIVINMHLHVCTYVATVYIFNKITLLSYCPTVLRKLTTIFTV